MQEEEGGGEWGIAITHLAKKNIVDIVVLVPTPKSRHSLRNPLRSTIIIAELAHTPDNDIVADEVLEEFVRTERGRKSDEPAQVPVGTFVRVRFT